MARVHPFHGVRFDPALVGDLAAVVSPPYDVIPESDLEGYRSRSPYNVVRLVRPGEDYSGAARLGRAWLASGVLRRDPEPAFYLHEQGFEGRIRRGLIAAVGLSPYGEGEVLPHEKTHGGAKADRLELYRAAAMAYEPLWFVYRGAGTDIPSLLASGFSGPPEVEFTTDEGQTQRIWPVSDPRLTAGITAAFGPLPLLIADGHHRYETALTYAAERGAEGNQAANHAMVLLVDIDDPGLLVLPTHRVMKAAPVAITGGEPAGSLEAVLEALPGHVAAGHYAGGRFQVLPLEGDLPLVELHRQLIDNMLGKRSAEELLIYTRNAEEAVSWVDSGVGQQAFFLPPPDLAAVLTLAEKGRVLPQKSTFFHPKPPSGMVFQSLEGREP